MHLLSHVCPNCIQCSVQSKGDPVWMHCCRQRAAATHLTCRKAKAIELMLVDALIAADPVLKMTERIHDPREFIKMDDTLVKQIENYSLLHPHYEDSDDFAPITASQKIITRSAVCFQRDYNRA